MSLPFDAIIVGTGQAGPPFAEKLAGAGWKVAIIERRRLGGTRVDLGRAPSKTLIASAQAAHYNRHAEDFGIVPSIAVTMDMPSVKRRMRSIVEAGREETERRLDGIPGCTVYEGRAEFVSSTAIRVEDSVLHAPKIFLNVGARPSAGNLDISGVAYLTSSTILELDEVPQKLFVVGGGLVGVEFAQIYRRFGADVTLVERSSRLVPCEDRDASLEIQSILESEGVEVLLDAECIRVMPGAEGVELVINSQDRLSTLAGSHVLLALGRTPNTDDLAVERSGIQLTAEGYIPVDTHLRSKVPGIWALGECNGRGVFDDTSFDDFEVVAANLLGGDQERSISDRIPAHALFTDPPLAQVGMTEEEVRGLGRPALIGFSRMTRVEHAVQKSDVRGFIKLLVSADSKQILGGTILGRNADEAIHSVLTAMMLGVQAQVLERPTQNHTTIAELIRTLLGELKPLV